MKVYIKKHGNHAGKWIYKGYQSAWESLGYVTEYYDQISEINTKEPYQLMSLDFDIKKENLPIVINAERAYVFAQPNTFPKPWGIHPNFYSACKDEEIKTLNKAENVHLWTFTETCANEHYFKWKDVNTVRLAFDSINYEHLEDDQYKFDVCFIGGWANNGYNEKRKIMLEHFSEFINSDINCGIFINKGISHEIENKILYNSKVSLNIHDAYQRALGLDTNERTFKSLGLNGFLISDSVDSCKKIFPDIPYYSNPGEMKELVQHYIKQDLEEVKNKNRKAILENHTYVDRVKELLKL
jgi:spore maturation protein CgeB